MQTGATITSWDMKQYRDKRISLQRGYVNGEGEGPITWDEYPPSLRRLLSSTYGFLLHSIKQYSWYKTRVTSHAHSEKKQLLIHNWFDSKIKRKSNALDFNVLI